MESNHQYETFLSRILYTPDCGQKYLRTESLIGLGFSLLLVTNNLAFRYESISNWIVLFTLTRILDILLKLWLLSQLASIKTASDSQYLVFVKVKSLIYSKPFILAKSINYISYILVVYSIVKLLSQDPTNMTDIRVNTFVFLLRFTIAFIDYLREMNKEIRPFVLPAKCWKTIESIKAFHAQPEDLQIRENCGVCTMNFQDAELVKRLPCNDTHIFHSTCIDSWFLRKQQCPLCRKCIA